MEEKGVLEKAVEDRVAILTLNRPDHANALSKALLLALTDAMNQLSNDDNVHVIVITGKGDKAFCAGIDLKERAKMPKAEIMPYREKVIRPCFDALAHCEKPLIAAINGGAYGGGAELALVCDIRIASTTAKFAQSEIKWGMIPACGGCQRLRLIVGLGRAKEIIFTGEAINAEEGEKLGIFNKVVPPERLMEETIELARNISKHSLVALRQAKKAIDVGSAIGEACEYEFELSKECYYHGEAMQGPEKFQ